MDFLRGADADLGSAIIRGGMFADDILAINTSMPVRQKGLTWLALIVLVCGRA